MTKPKTNREIAEEIVLRKSSDIENAVAHIAKALDEAFRCGREAALNELRLPLCLEDIDASGSGGGGFIELNYRFTNFFAHPIKDADGNCFTHGKEKNPMCPICNPDIVNRFSAW